MPRSVNHVASKARRKKILKLTRGYFGARKNVWTVAKNTWEKGLTYAFRDLSLIHILQGAHDASASNRKLDGEQQG